MYSPEILPQAPKYPVIQSLAETGWIYVKELILRSSNVLYYKIEPDMLFNFFDIIEDTIVNQTRLRTVKL